MKIEELIKRLTREEKASLCSGKNVWELKDVDRLKIKGIMVADGPHGLRKQVNKSDNLGINKSVKATCFPPAVTTACSFNRKLLQQMGQAIANECIKEEVDVLLGPGINIKRSPLCGRNFEYFSEDPFLAGELGAAFVRGVQSKGIGTSVKHYAANNQEQFRMTISSVVDERALREIYLAPFERVVREQPYTIMCSYNQINGLYASENKKLLTDILRDEWGFNGVVVTDWGACNDRVLGLKAGQDVEMPSSYGLNDRRIVEALINGELDEAVLDQTVERVLSLYAKCQHEKILDKDIDHHDLARQIAGESMVLLKNEEEILPLNLSSSIGIIGELARKPRYQGSGSSKINPILLENVYDGLINERIPFKYARGYDVTTDEVNETLMKEAVGIAREVDIPIVFIGLTERYESEGFDRGHLDLPTSHNELVKRVSDINPNTIVVLAGGSPVTMPWIYSVKGLLNSYLGGESGALAIIDILFGRVNPSGKLAETYPLKLQDHPSHLNFPGGNASVHYKESIYVGYRYFDTAKSNVLFPFGYGLSYTKFAYSDLTLSSDHITDQDELTVTFKVKNIGKVDGAEIVQLYVKDLNPVIFKADKELKEFDKVFLKAGEEQGMMMTLNKRSFTYYNTIVNDWHVSKGTYEILIGSSSRDILLSAQVKIESKDVDVPYVEDELLSYKEVHNNQFSDEDFKVLVNNELPPLHVKSKRPYHINSTIEEISQTFVGKQLKKYGLKTIQKQNSDETTRLMMERSFLEIPLRSVISFSGASFTENRIKGLLCLINGKYVKGLAMILKRK